MVRSPESIIDHLAQLRNNLIADKWMSRVEPPVLAVYNELLKQAKELAPRNEVLRVMERPGYRVSARSLLMLVDQILVALDR